MARKNDCLLIYDNESSSLQLGEDNSLLLSYVNFVDEKLTTQGLKTHHHSRDSTPGEPLIKELEREVDSSQVVLLILDKGFLENSWSSFCKDVTIKKLIDESFIPGCPGSNCFIPILIKLKNPDIPFELKALKCIHIMNESDIEDVEKWIQLTRALSYHFNDQFPSAAAMPHNFQFTPEYPNTSAEPRESRVNTGSNDASFPNPNSVNTTSDSFSTGSNASRQSNENETSEQRNQERNFRTKESETNQSITEISNEIEGATNVEMNESNALDTNFRTLSVQLADLEVDDQQSMPTSPFQVTERESSDTCSLVSPVIISNNLNQDTVLVNSSIQQDASDRDVNQNLEAAIAASGGDLRQRESLYTIAEPMSESTTSSACKRPLSRPTASVQPYKSHNTCTSDDDDDDYYSIHSDDNDLL